MVIIMKYRHALLYATALAVVLVSTIVTSAQTPANQSTSTIMGTLLDVADARIEHARIRIENKQFKWAGETDEAGDFTAVVPPGTYRIFAEANGFRRFESPFLKAKPDIKEMVNLHLEILTIIDTVIVQPKKHP